MKPTPIGARIRKARELAGMEQRELAARIGISTSHLRNVEMGLKHGAHLLQRAIDTLGPL